MTCTSHLPEETGQEVSFHVTGNLRLATCKERMDEYHKYCGTANTIGVPFEIISPDEVAKLWPLCNTEGLVGALYHPHDGHIAPADVTQAMAIGARNMGATIHRDTNVPWHRGKAGGEWLVKTAKGDITCEHVVCATGNYSWQTSQMLGIYIPAIPVEHQYIVTDEVPELVERHRAGLPEMAVLRESDASITCARNAKVTSSDPTKKERRRDSRTVSRKVSSAISFPAIWNG